MNKFPQAFTSLDEMAEAYATHYNAGYGDQTDKHFTVEDVKAVCVRKLFKPDARVYGITLNNHTVAIEHFGYVQA